MVLPPRCPLPALCSDYGYVARPHVFTKAFEVIGDHVDMHEYRLVEEGNN